MAGDGTPRRGVESDPVRALASKLAALERQVQAMSKAANLRNASISGGEGVTVIDPDGFVRLRIDPAASAIVAYDQDGLERARFGLMAYSSPGQYGLEVLWGGNWVYVGEPPAG